MIRLIKIWASFFGIGYLKGGGTWAAAITCALWYGFRNTGRFYTAELPLVLIIIITGIWSGNRVEKDWGKDSNRVVIDEVAGMAVSLLWLPVHIYHVTAALILFRFFDILKPLMIRKAEALPGGWGVMADDVLAGIYANILLQLAVYINTI